MSIDRIPQFNPQIFGSLTAAPVAAKKASPAFAAKGISQPLGQNMEGFDRFLAKCDLSKPVAKNENLANKLDFVC